MCGVHQLEQCLCKLASFCYYLCETTIQQTNLNRVHVITNIITDQGVGMGDTAWGTLKLAFTGILTQYVWTLENKSTYCKNRVHEEAVCLCKIKPEAHLT